MNELYLLPTKKKAKEFAEKTINPSMPPEVTAFIMGGETFRVSKTIPKDQLGGNTYVRNLPKHISSAKFRFKDYTFFIINDCKKKR